MISDDGFRFANIRWRTNKNGWHSERLRNSDNDMHVVAYGEPSPPLEEGSILLYDDGVAHYHHAVQTGQYIIKANHYGKSH